MFPITDQLIRQPKSLEHIAILKIGDWVASQAEELLTTENKTEDVLSNKIDAMRHHLDRSVPHIYRDKLVIEATRALRELLTKIEASSEVRDSEEKSVINNIIGRMTDTFLYSENLTKLTLVQIGKYVPSFTESYKLTGLTHLDVEDFSPAQVIPLLKELHNLKVLKYWDHCTNDVLNCLVDNCKLIEELFLSHIDDQGIFFLTQLPNLRGVIFSDYTSISQEVVETLLLSCKNIEIIDFVRDDIFSPVMENVLGRIASSKNNVGKHFKLKSLGKCSSFNNMQVVQMCPLLQEVRLDWKCKGDNLMYVQDFQELRKLEIKSRPICEDVTKLLQVKGRYLTKFKMFNSTITLNELMCITQMCPNLESLTIHIYKDHPICRLINLSTETSVKNIPQLVKLKTLSISGDYLTDETLF